MRRQLRVWTALVMVTVVMMVELTPRAAFAQAAPPPTAAASPAAVAPVDEARTRYQRGLDLYADKNYEAARIEFARAYKLAPSYKILYNIGVCDGQLGDYVAAISSLEKYLQQGGSEVVASRRTEVEDLLRQLRPRIAKLTVTSNVTGALVQIDDVNLCEERGTCSTPMSVPMLVNPGRRRVTVSKAGWIPQTRSIVVAGSESAKIDIILSPSVVQKNVNFAPYAAWGVTGLFAIGAGVTGGLALHASSQQNDLLAQNGSSQSELDSNRSKMRTYSVIADTCAGIAVASGVVALILTIKTAKREGPPGSTAQLGVGPGNLALSGSF